MSKSTWFGYWVFVVTLLVISFLLAVNLNYQGLTDYLLNLGNTSKFQALNVIGVAVTLLSGLLAVYGFYWFVIYTIYNPVYYRIPAWIYLTFRFANPRKVEFRDHYRLVYKFHQQLLLRKSIVERYSEALQKSNYGLEIVLVDNVKEALTQAIYECFGKNNFLAIKLEESLLELLTGVGQTIELSKVYRIQLWLLITAGYCPTKDQLDSAYKYLTLKFAFATTVHGGECLEEEFKGIKLTLEKILPSSVAQELNLEQNNLSPRSLYQTIQTLLTGES